MGGNQFPAHDPAKSSGLCDEAATFLLYTPGHALLRLSTGLGFSGNVKANHDFNRTGFFPHGSRRHGNNRQREYDMRQLHGMIFKWFFRELDPQIESLRDLRDSYRAMNVEIYGEQMASLLNDW